jgi:hypothetical protein
MDPDVTMVIGVFFFGVASYRNHFVGNPSTSAMV